MVLSISTIRHAFSDWFLNTIFLATFNLDIGFAVLTAVTMKNTISCEWRRVVQYKFADVSEEGMASRAGCLLLAGSIIVFPSWRWRQYFPVYRQWTSAGLYMVTLHEIVFIKVLESPILNCIIVFIHTIFSREIFILAINKIYISYEFKTRWEFS
jgi:hypothetical protein